VGAVDEMLRKGEWREPEGRVSGREALWNILCGCAIALAFVCGGLLVIPEAGSRSHTALLWAGYGALFSAVVFALDRATSRFRRSRVVRGLGLPLRMSVLVSMFSTALALVPERDAGLRVASIGLAGALTAILDRAVRRRQTTHPNLEDQHPAEVF
jgi:hypothetical protein